MQGTTGLKPIGMGRNPAHRMKTDRAPHHVGIGTPAKNSPAVIQTDFLVKGHGCNFRGKRGDPLCRDATPIRDRVRGVIRIHEVLDHGGKDSDRSAA